MNSYIGKQIDSSTYMYPKECQWNKFTKRNNCQSYGYLEVSWNVNVYTRFDVQNIWRLDKHLSEEDQATVTRLGKPNGYFIQTNLLLSLNYLIRLPHKIL